MEHNHIVGTAADGSKHIHTIIKESK